MPLSPELEREIAEAGKAIAPYINRRKAQICTQAGSTASGGNPKTGAPTGRIWVKAEGNHMPIAAWNAVAFDGIVGAWVVVADDRVSGEPTIIEVLARENVQRGGALYASQIAAGPQQSPTTQRPRHNYSAITAPTVSDDETSHYSTNSLWVNTSTGTAYICTDASTGAAVWQVIGSGSGTVETIVAGTGISVDDTDPANPIVSATGGSSANFGSEATIALDASGVLDLTSETSRNILVESESGTSDTLTEVSGLSAGEKVWLRAASGHTITVDHNNAGATDKILLYSAVDIVLSEDNPLELGKVASGKVAQPVDENDGGSGGGASDYIHFRDEKTANTSGGDFTTGAWRTRDLNTEVADTGNHASLSSNEITLPAGTYECRISVPAYAVNAHRARLYNVTDTAEILLGTTEYAGNTTNGMTRSWIVGRFTIAGTKNIRVEHICALTKTTNGFGLAANLGVTELYTVVEMWKLA